MIVVFHYMLNENQLKFVLLPI